MRKNQPAPVRHCAEVLENRLLLSAGELDTTFGTGGRMTLGGLASFESASDVAVQSDGRLVVMGNSANLYRYNIDGSPDTSFGQSGKLGPLFNDSTGVVARAVFVQPDQKIIFVGGGSNAAGHQVVRIERFTSAGQADPTFGTGGMATFDIGLTSGAFFCAALGLDGKILIGGYVGNPGGPCDSFIFRVNSDGSADSTFGAGGLVVHDFGPADVVNSLAEDTSGRVFTAGTINGLTTSNSTLVVARFTPAGALDTTFANNGTISFANATGLTDSITLQSSGQPIIAFGLNVISVVRLDDQGGLDPGFGTSGRTDIPGIIPPAGAPIPIAIQSDGKILVGSTINGNWAGRQFEIARLTADGQLDADFADNGIAENAPFSNNQGALNRLRVGPNDQIIAEGQSVGLSKTLWGALALQPNGVAVDNIATAPDGSVTFTGTLRSQALHVSQVGDVTSIADGTDVYNLTDISALNILAGGGNDSLLVDPGVTPPVSFDGGDGTDSVTLNGTDGPDHFTAMQTGLSGAGSSITVANVESKLIEAGQGDDTLDSTNGGVTFDGGAGNDQATISGTFSGVIFNGGDNDDAMIVDFPVPPSVLSARFDGGTGTNTLTVNGAPTDIGLTATDSGDPNFRALSSLSANLSYRLINLITINCGSGNDNIHINNSPDSFVINGGGGNDLIEVHGVNATINGGDGNDLIQAQDGTAQSIDGGPGADTALVDTFDPLVNVETPYGGALRGTVFQDDNANGVKDVGEPTIAFVNVFIDTNNNGQEDGGEPSTISDISGNYLIAGSNFLPFAGGQLKVRALVPYSYNAGTPASGLQTVPTPGATDETGVNFAMVRQPSTLVGSVYRDVNRNGTFDSSDVPLSGWTVFVDDNNNAVQDAGELSTQTDTSGAFKFNLPSGTHTIRVVAPTGFTPSRTGGDVVTTNAPPNDTGSTGVFLFQAPPATISGTVYNDLNGDGIRDNGEPVIASRLLFRDLNSDGFYELGEPRLITNASGVYTFSIDAGTYSFGPIAIAGWSVTSQTAAVKTITVAFGQVVSNADFGLRQTISTATVQGLIFRDNNANALFDAGDFASASVSVYIDLNNNGVFDPGEFISTADSSGNYSIPILPNQNQVIRQFPFNSLTLYFTAPVSGSYTVNSPANQIITGKNFGMTTGASVSGTLYGDLNGNGKLDPGETGSAGWEVELFANDIVQSDLLATVTTDSSGHYEADAMHLHQGIVVAVPFVPAGWIMSGSSIWSVNIGGGSVSTYTGIDFYATQLGLLSGTLYNDQNGNGLFDNTEGRLVGWTVYVDLNNNGRLDSNEPSEVTDFTGNYQFGLPAGNYVVRDVVPSGYRPTSPSSPVFNASVQLAVRNANQNFGNTTNGRIAGTVFGDTNGDGFRDTGEAGMPAINVYLDTNANGQFDAGEPATVTDSSGAYVFPAVTPGAYSVQLQLPTGWRQTDDLSSLTLNYSAASDVSDMDMGIQGPPVANLGGPYAVAEGSSVNLSASGSSEVGGTIAKYEWDTDYNGTTFVARASGVSTSFSAVGLDGPGSRAIALRVTDANGITSVATGSVTINNAPPKATFAAGGAVTLGSAGSVSFSAASDPSPADVTAGFKYSYDFNNDGTFETANSTSATATVPASYLATTGAHTIHGRIIDKDGGFTDYTTTIQVNAASGGASISGLVYNDANGNGVRDSGEAVVSGQKLFIDKNTNSILDAGEPTFTTGAAGTFTFSGLAAGTYRIREVAMSGWRWTNPTSGYFNVTVTANQVVTGKSFGETTNALISGIVFKDANANAKLDTGEVALSGWVVYLDTNNNGILDTGEKSFTTGTDGKFSFVVPAGTYHLREVLKSGFTITTPAGGLYTLTLASGQSATGKNFGDK